MTMQAGKVDTTIDRAGGCLERLRSGCILVGFNLFFLFFIGLFLYFANRDYQLAQVGVTTVGTVIGLDESSSGEGGCCVYSPIVEFNADGQSYTFTSSNASDPPSYEVEETVTVLYDPDNPQRAEVEGGTFWLLWAGLVVLFIVIMLFMNIWGGIRIVRGQSIDD